jgi:putative ABC transport system permease protein
MFTLLQIAARNLARNRKRTLLLGGAIAIVTVLLVLLTSLFNGTQAAMLRNATTLSTGHVNVAGFYKITSGTAAPVVTDFAKLREIVEKETPEVQTMVVRGRGFGKLVSDASSQIAVVSGIDIAQEAGFKNILEIVHGDVKRLSEPHSILIFEQTAERLELKIGDNVTLSSQTYRGAQNSIDCKVVAIAKPLGMFSSFFAYVPLQTLRDLYGLDPTTAGGIQLYLKDWNQAEAVANRLRITLEKHGYRVMDHMEKPYWQKFDIVKREDWTGQKIDVTTWMDEDQFMKWTLVGFKTLIVIVFMVLLSIIIIGVMNTLWMAIRERTREVGALRAIGMQRYTVLLMFVTEGALLALISSTSGAILGVVAAYGLNAAHLKMFKGFQMVLMSETINMLVSVPTVLISLLVIACVTTLGSILPAWRAARLQPVEAMHSSN